MSRAWHRVERARTAWGEYELRRRGAPEDRDFLLLVDGRVLMNSRAGRSEIALAELACGAIADRPAPRILIGGLGMAITARAALDALGPDAHVDVAEIEPIIVDWCRGPLAVVSDDALADPRLAVDVTDVAEKIASTGLRDPYDAILLDLLEGPHAGTDAEDDPLYGRSALARTRDALAPGGVLAVWSEDPDRGFEARLRALGLELELHRPGRGGRRHAVYLARRASSPANSATTRSRPSP
ncbi:MAG: spermidine synthase [Myxococcota bacterium]